MSTADGSGGSDGSGGEMKLPQLKQSREAHCGVFTRRAAAIRQWLERFKQFTKREHKTDITPLFEGEEMTDSGWAEKEQAIQGDFIWGVGPEALFRRTRAEYRTDPDSIKIKDPIRLYTENYLSKRNTYHNRRDFSWAKQSEEETPEDFLRQLIEIEKECNFNTISAEELLVSKYVTAIIDKKLRDKVMKEKTLE